MDVLKDMLDKNAVEYTEIRFRSEETVPSINAFVSCFIPQIYSFQWLYSVKKTFMRDISFEIWNNYEMVTTVYTSILLLF